MAEYDPTTHKVVPKDAVIVVLGENASSLPNALRRIAGQTVEVKGRAALRRLADQIENQVPKPRITEPGPWGVVEAGVRQHDVRLRWVRLGDNWRCEDSDEYDRLWDDLLNPALVREGV